MAGRWDWAGQEGQWGLRGEPYPSPARQEQSVNQTAGATVRQGMGDWWTVEDGGGQGWLGFLVEVTRGWWSHCPGWGPRQKPYL